MSVGNTTVDERIVEMRIDNEKFEAGAKKTIGILESLDRSLKGLGQENADGFDNIGKSLDKVTDRFSAMGIVGDQIMRNLTNKTMELVGQLKNMSTMLTTQQVGAGWNKYADKTQAIQTIMAATNKTIEEGRFADQAEQLEWVNEEIEKLNKFTDETSYNFLDMVGNIGKFTAAGRELEESVTAMEGIANWAAISGGRPAEAGRAMYNLSQALGMGAVTTIDWKSIENANMATYEFKQQAIDAAVAVGTLRKVTDGLWETVEGGYEVTVENFRNSLSFGRGTDAIHWFNSDVLLSVLNRYGEFADRMLATVNEFDNVDTVTNYLKYLKSYKAGGLEQLQKDFELTQATIDEILPSLQEFSKAEYDLGFRAFQAAQEAKTFTEAIDATKDAVSTKWMTVFELLFGNYLEAKELWTNMAETFWDIFASPVDRLIDIIKGSGGFFSEDGIFQGFISGAKQAVGGTGALEESLSAVGKTMKDFEKALEKTLGPNEARKLMDSYGTITDALKDGAISAETFKKALGELDDSYDPSKPVSLNRALNKAGKTMADFEKALKDAMEPKEVVEALRSYASIEDAFRNGAISVDDFKKALETLGIDSENVASEVENTVAASVGSLEELRNFALEVLRGDHGNGDERLAWYESMGLDAELMQAMAGDLKNMGYYISDEALMGAMEAYYQYNNLASRLGYATFAEYLASITSTTEEYIYDMNNMADEADMIYASIFGEGVLDEMGEYRSAGELFRESITNLLEALDNFGAAFDKAFMRVFGGSDDYDEQIGKMSDGFFTLTLAFWSFTERVKAFSESETFLNFATAFFSIIRLIGKALSVVFKIGKIGLSFVLKLLSPILTLVTGIFDIITTGLDAVSRSLESSDLIGFIEALGDELLSRIEEPIEKINNVITGVINAFKKGFDEGGFTEGLHRVGETLDLFFENSPVALTIIHALEKAFTLLANAIGAVVGVAGGLFGGAVMAVIGVFSTLIDWIGKVILWAKDSEILNAIWTSIAETFTKVGNVLKRVFGKGGYVEQGFEEGGFVGAFNVVVDSFERGLTRLVPGGEKIVSVIEALRNVFRKKTTDENGVEQLVDDTEGKLLSLEETFDERGGFFTNIIRGAGGDEEAKEEVQEGVTGLVQSAWQGFLNGLRNIRISDVIDALKLGVIANVLLKVGHGLNIFNGIADSIADIPDRFTDMMEDIGQTFRSLSFDIKANAVLKFAVAAGIIAGAIWILSKIPSEQLEKASSVVIAILTVLTLLSGVLSKTSASIFQTIQYMPALGAALIGFAMTISSIGTTALILALVAKFVGVDELKNASAAVINILVAIGALITAVIGMIKLGRFNAEQIKSIGSVFRSIGLGMMGIALAVQMLMIPVLAFCAVLKFARGSAGIKKFWNAIGAVLAFMGAIALLIWSLSASVNGFTAEQIGQIGNFMMKVAASLVIMAFAFDMLVMPILVLSAAQKFLKFNIKGIIGAITVLGIIALLISGILAIFGGVMSNKADAQIKAVGSTLIKFAASLLLISLGVGLLAKPIIAIAKLSEQMESKQIIASLLVLLGTITILTGLLAIISKVMLKNNGSENATRLGEGLLKIAKAITLLSAAALLLTPAIILLTGAIGAFIYILGRMKDDRWLVFQNGLDRLGKLWKSLMLFGAALAVVGLAATLTGTGILSMALGILVFTGAIALLMVAFPFVVEAFKKLEEIDDTKIVKSIGKAWLMLGGLIIAMTLFAYGVSRIYSLLGGGAFRRLGEGFTKTIKDMATGMRSGVSNGFASVLKFLQDDKNKQAILATLESLIIVGAAYVAGVLPTVSHVVVGGIVGLLNAVASEFRSQAPEIVDAITNIVGAILDLAKGLMAKLFGEESWSEMSWWQKGIADLGGGLLVINKVAGLFSFGKAEESAGTLSDKIFGVAEKITDAKDKVTNLKDAFNDTKAAVGLLVEAAGGLSVALPVALALAAAVGYANHELNAQQDILRTNAGDPKSLEEYANSIAQVETRIAELTELEKSGWGTEMSSQELAAQQLLLSTLQKEYEELKVAQGTAAASANEFASGIRNAKDAMDMLSTVDLSEYGYTMEQISRMTDGEVVAVAREIEQSLGQAWENVGVSAVQAETQVQEASSTIDTLKTKLSELGFNGETKISDIGVDKFQEILNSSGISLDLSSLNITGFDSLGAILENAGLNDLGPYLTSGMGKGILNSEGLSSLFGSATSLKDLTVNKFLELFGIASPSTVMANEVGQYIPAGIGMGIDQNYYQAVNPLYTLMDQMLLAFTNVREYFIGAGTQVVSGLLEGINQNMVHAYEAGQNLATSVENGFRETLDIHSPSRVFAELARYIPIGISQGINQESDTAISSVVVLSDALIDAIMQSMAMVSTVADDEFEFTPTITPVVDLSNVSSAASSMSGAFDRSYSMSAQMSDAINRRMSDVERVASNVSAGQTINNGDNITFNIYQQPGEDPNAIADAVMLRMQNRAVRRTAAFG